MRARAALFVPILVGLVLSGVPLPAGAAELPEAVVRVNRAPGAETCPAEAELVNGVVAASRVAPRERGPSKPIVDVNLERYGDTHFATIRVAGGAHGVRTLQAEGAACDALRDAVVLALLVLLERDAAPPVASAAEPAPVPERASTERRTNEERLSLHAGAGGALTFWEPLRAFPALSGGLGVALGSWEGGARLQWSPPRSIHTGPGSVDVQAWGATARLCHAILSREFWRVSGCGLGSLFALSGQGRGLDAERRRVRPWWRAGLGLQATVSLTPQLAVTTFGNVFVTLHEETFSVGGLGEQFGTSAITGHVGAELRVGIF